MKNLIQLSTFLLLCLSLFGCNKSDDELCELGPSLPILCIEIYDPVCGCDNVTYGNDCLASAAGVPSFSPGECP